ncbi:MAG: ATP-dependent DNA helicase RecQ [Pirellulales bacterium]
MTVSSLDTPSIDGALKQHFGFDRFHKGQREVIEHLLAGRSSVAVFPTGGGKSLCYQLPSLLLPGLTLVVSPLIALMKDQIDALAVRGIAAARLDSSLTADAYREVMQRVRLGDLKMLYVAPERFNNERFREAMRGQRISLFAVDEAHCISEWGHNFRPDYLKLARYAEACAAERVLGLTATATEPVLADICRLFRIPDECAVRTGFYRSNLTVLTTPVDESQRDAMLVERFTERPAGPTIVYVTLQRTAEGVAERLVEARFPAKAYHAGMPDDLRAEVQDWFLESDRGIVVATIAFGMGIDKSNIRYVYHYNLPKSLENFSQEIGRAGRDGEPAICEMFACPDDLCVLENFIYGDTPTADSVQGLLQDVLSQGEAFGVSPYELAAAHDIRVLVVRTLLTYLELEGLLEGGTAVYSTYQFTPLATSQAILARFEGGRREFLSGLFRQARKAKKWLYLDVAEAATALGTPRERIIRALDYLHDEKLLEVRAAGVRHRYRRLKTPASLDQLATTLHERTVQRESRELARLAQVLDLVRHDGCQVSHLGAHFGQPLDQPCGHCSWCCHDRQAAVIPQRRTRAIDDALWEQAERLRTSHLEILADPRAFARLLCGIASPRMIRAKLTKDRLFGVLADVPFQTVIARASR